MGTAVRRRIVVVAGATATGKTALAVELARLLNGELVGADSVQVYRRLDIGSAKPVPAELQGVPHHLLDVAELSEPFDAARYVALADPVIEAIAARGRAPIVVGGTGLYLRALIRGLAEGIASEPGVRAALNARAARGPEELRRMHAELAAVDPVYAARIHVQDRIRIVRAMEVFAATGVPLSAHHARHAQMPPRYDALFVALDVPRAELRERIARRAGDMLARGWVDEVRAILADGVDPDLKPLRSVGYAEVVRHVREGVSLEETRAAVEQATAGFAKRQRTWFRGEREVHWVTPAEARTAPWLDRIRAHLDGGASTSAEPSPSG
jgi:tRNA dimethylallyltransferase